MTRYVTRPRQSKPRADYDDYVPFLPSIDVDGPAEVDTGLVSAEGLPIMRIPPPCRLREG